MPRAKFAFFDAIGDSAWAIIITMIGYWFGSKIPNIDNYIVPVVIIVVVLSFGPVLYHLAQAMIERKKKRKSI
jgi:membrane-associated protein